MKTHVTTYYKVIKIGLVIAELPSNPIKNFLPEFQVLQKQKRKTNVSSMLCTKTKISENKTKNCFSYFCFKGKKENANSSCVSKQNIPYLTRDKTLTSSLFCCFALLYISKLLFHVVVFLIPYRYAIHLWTSKQNQALNTEDITIPKAYYAHAQIIEACGQEITDYF